MRDAFLKLQHQAAADGGIALASESNETDQRLVLKTCGLRDPPGSGQRKHPPNFSVNVRRTHVSSAVFTGRDERRKRVEVRGIVGHRTVNSIGTREQITV